MYELFALLTAPPTYQGLHRTSDGKVYSTAALAWLHELVEAKWKALLPTLSDAHVLSQTRMDLRLSQGELARKSGISVALLSMIESGQRRMTESTAEKVWSALCRIDQARKEYTTPEILVRIEDECELVTTQIEKLTMESERL